MNNPNNQDISYDPQQIPQNQSLQNFQQQELQYEDMVAQKLQELQIIQGQKIRQLEQQLNEKDSIMKEIHEKYNKLEDKFNYNLQVMDQRENYTNQLGIKLKELIQVCDERKMEIEVLKNEKADALKQVDDNKERMTEKNRTLFDKIEELKQEVKFYKNNYNQELLKHKEAASLLANLDNSSREVEQKIRSECENRIEQIKQDNRAQIATLENLIESAKQYRTQHTNEIQVQNERLLKQNEELLAERIQLKAQLIEKERAQAQEIFERNARVQEALTLAQHAQQEAQNLKSANNGWDVVMREKLQLAQQEKEELLQTLNQYKQKSKQKIQSLREEGEVRFEELIRENSARLKRLQQELRDLQQQNDFLTISEKNLKERHHEILSSHRREIEEQEHKHSLHMKNIEEDKRQLKNEIQIKEFQNNQLSEDNQRELKKSAQCEMENQELLQQIRQLENENNLLIEQLVFYKKNFPNVNFGSQLPSARHHNFQSPNKREREAHNLQAEGGDLKNESFEKLFSEDMGYVNVKSSLMANHPHNQEHIQQPFEQFQRIKELEFDVKTYKEVIDDMTREMQQAKQKMDFNSQELRLIKEECIDLRNKLSEKKLEAMDFRQQLQRYELDNRELSKDIVEKKTFDQVQQAIKLKDEAIHTLKQQNTKLQKEIQSLKRERDSLSDISSNLKSKCIEYEERLEIQQYGDRGIDPQELRAQNEVYFKQLYQMEEQLLQCEDELKRWQKIDLDKQNIIEQLKEELIQNNKLFKHKSIPALSVVSHYNHMKRQEQINKQNSQQKQNIIKNIPNYNQFEEIDNVPTKLNKAQNIQDVSPQKQRNTDLNINQKDKCIQQAQQHFKKELIELYDHINPDSAQFIQGKTQQNNYH